jgi:hypothetical protein
MKVSNPEFYRQKKANDRRKKVNTTGMYAGSFLSDYYYSIDPKYIERTEE